MNKTISAALVALAGLAASASAQVPASFSDLVLGFRANGGQGQTTNLEVNLGSVSQFSNLSAGTVLEVTRLAPADLVGIYGSNWSTRSDLFWGVIGTAGRLVGGPGGQTASTLWATNAEAAVDTPSTPWIPGSRNAQTNASATIETVFFAAPGSLNGKTATANSSSSSAVNATLSGSYTTQVTAQPGTSFGFFNPTIENSAKVSANAYAVSDLYELQPGATAAAYLGSFGLSSAGQLVFARSAAYFNPPGVTTQPSNQSASAGGNVTLTAAAGGGATFQWQRNGSNLANGAVVGGASTSTLSLTGVQPADTGVYAAVVSNPGSSTATQGAIVGVTTTSKVIASGSEVGANIAHPNGNVYDQVLLTGAAATITADSALNQVTRISYVDLTNDIVQVEFAGPGTLSLVLDNASGPAVAVNYNQPTVTYMKGHAGIVITGANENTNVTVFSVGRINAVNQALFRSDVTYDGMADIAFIAIASTNGKFGGVRASNTSFLATRGLTGLYAPGVQFTGPVFIGDINASDTATPVLQIGSATDVRITGGDLKQDNSRGVVTSGLSTLRFTDGSTSHGGTQAAQAVKGRLVQGGLDVTSTVALPPGQ